MPAKLERAHRQIDFSRRALRSQRLTGARVSNLLHTLANIGTRPVRQRPTSSARAARPRSNALRFRLHIARRLLTYSGKPMFGLHGQFAHDQSPQLL